MTEENNENKKICLICGLQYNKLYLNLCKGCLSTYSNDASRIKRIIDDYISSSDYILHYDFTQALYETSQILSRIHIIINGSDVMLKNKESEKHHCINCDYGIKYGAYNCPINNECYKNKESLLPKWRPIVRYTKEIDVDGIKITEEILQAIFTLGIKNMWDWEKNIAINKLLKNKQIKIKILEKHNNEKQE